MQKKTPSHMSSNQFTRYIYTCAIRDRESYLEAIARCADMADAIKETKEELEAMENRLADFDKRNKT